MKYRNMQTAYHQAAHPDQAATSNQTRTRSRWDRPTRLGQKSNDTGKENIVKQREQTGNAHLTWRSQTERGESPTSPSTLCPTMGTRGLQTSRSVHVHELNERKEEETEEEVGRGPSSPETNSMAGRVRVCEEGPPLSHRAEKRQRPLSQSRSQRT